MLMEVNIGLKRVLLFHDAGPYHIETSTLICSLNQWTGFYMIRTSDMKELKKLLKKLVYMKQLIFTDLTAAPNDRVLLNFYSIKGGKSTQKLQENLSVKYCYATRNNKSVKLINIISNFQLGHSLCSLFLG